MTATDGALSTEGAPIRYFGSPLSSFRSTIRGFTWGSSRLKMVTAHSARTLNKRSFRVHRPFSPLTVRHPRRKLSNSFERRWDERSEERRVGKDGRSRWKPY